MGKFNTPTATPTGLGPVLTEASPSGITGQGGDGYARDAKSELFLLAVSNMVGEPTFYETGQGRDARFLDLVARVAVEDGEWTARFAHWLRAGANMRSASLVVAAEAVRARLAAKVNGASNRALIASVLARADEPGELLAYWTGRYGRAIPKPIKRGIGDAIGRLYNERNLLKYDGQSKGFRFGDVLELTHAKPTATWQGDLFAHAITRRHKREQSAPESLTMLRARESLMATPLGERRAVLINDPDRLAAAGMTWESLAGWMEGPMDAQAWEAIIPSMGYMALLRNLRNFDEAGVPDAVATAVAARIANADEVARSRQLPMRFLSAYRAAPSLRWAWALEQALNMSLANVPVLSGRTLILVDRSGSMFQQVSGRSDLTFADTGAVFAVALALRAQEATLVQFGSTSQPVVVQPGSSVLPIVAGLTVLGGTYTAQALAQWYAGHDRVVIVTDEQAADDPARVLPPHVPMFTWNLAGYRYGHAPSGSGHRYTFGGLSDQGFAMIPLLEAGRRGEWPF